MKKSSKQRQSNFLKHALVFSGALVALLAFYIYNPRPAQNPSDPANEDQLSTYETPADVLAAKQQAETTGLPVLGIRADGPTYTIPIVMYHYIEHVRDSKDTIRISLNTLPETLDRQITDLSQAGYNFINASDLADILDGIKPYPVKPVMLTFDDGYRDFYTDALPIINKHQIKVVAYIVSGFENLPNNLTTSQLQEIAKNKLVEIGAHTVNHLALAGLSQDQAKTEIENSKLQLEKLTGRPITAFAYPYGSFNLQAIQIAKSAGYRTAVSTLPGNQVDNSVRFFLHRVRPGGATGQTLIALLDKANNQPK